MTPKQEAEEKAKLPKWFKVAQMVSGIIGAGFFGGFAVLNWPVIRTDFIHFFGERTYSYYWIIFFTIGVIGMSLGGLFAAIRSKMLDTFIKVVKKDDEGSDTK